VDRNSYCLSMLHDERNPLIVAMVVLSDQGNKLSTVSHETRRYLCLRRMIFEWKSFQKVNSFDPTESCDPDLRCGLSKYFTVKIEVVALHMKVSLTLLL
jgi:hypothetical protein